MPEWDEIIGVLGVVWPHGQGVVPGKGEVRAIGDRNEDVGPAVEVYFEAVEWAVEELHGFRGDEVRLTHGAGPGLDGRQRYRPGER